MNDLFAGLYADGKIFESSCAQRRQACDRIALTPILSPKLNPKFRTVLEICKARKMCARKKKAWHKILSKLLVHMLKNFNPISSTPQSSNGHVFDSRLTLARVNSSEAERSIAGFLFIFRITTRTTATML